MYKKIVFILLLVLLKLNMHAQQFKMGNKELTFILPNPLWHEAMVDSNPKIKMYRTVFKREAVEVANHVLVIPNIEIVVEKTNLSLANYSYNKQQAIKYKIDSNLSAKNGKLLLPNSKAYFAHYIRDGRTYKMFVIQCIYGGNGVQLVLDCTADVYDEVWEEFRYFVESLKLE